jgi:hypothetical protein
MGSAICLEEGLMKQKMPLVIGILISFNALEAFAQTTTTQPPAVPEPGTLGLMGVGLVVVGYSAWRQKKKMKK